MIVLIVGDD